MEVWTIFLLFFLCLALGIGGWLFFLWAVSTGQFEDVENQKYKIFDDEDKEEE